MDNETRLAILYNQVQDSDEEILRLLDERCAICFEIKKIRKELHRDTTDLNRESDVLSKLSKLEIHGGLVNNIWPAILEFTE